MSAAFESTQKPVATLVLYAFNEERYIRSAIEGAFAQTYSPLEIVLSDDGSTDETFGIMCEMATSYTGPHKVILNRNKKNIGIGSQLNAAYSKSSGTLIVLANGDDVSLPHRVETIVDAWRRSAGKVSAISSDMRIIDHDGQDLDRIFPMRGDYSDLADATYRRFGGAGAASLAFTRECFDVFGPLSDNLLLEDGPLNLRATLLGNWIFLDDPLVLYRVHNENMSQAYKPASFDTWQPHHRSAALWQVREGQKAFVQMLADLYGHQSDFHRPEVLQQARINAAGRLLDNQLRACYYSDSWPHSITEWWRMMMKLLITLAKITIKRIIPALEHRNDRWHYRSVLRTKLTSSASRNSKP